MTLRSQNSHEIFSKILNFYLNNFNSYMMGPLSITLTVIKKNRGSKTLWNLLFLSLIKNLEIEQTILASARWVRLYAVFLNMVSIVRIYVQYIICLVSWSPAQQFQWHSRVIDITELIYFLFLKDFFKIFEKISWTFNPVFLWLELVWTHNSWKTFM